MNKPGIDKLEQVAGLLNITNQKTGSWEPFQLYGHQKHLLARLLENDRSIVLKARQLGISTICLFYIFCLAILNENINVGIVADNFANSQGLLEKIKDFSKQLGIATRTDNTKKLVLSNGSTFTAITVNSGIGKDNTAGRSKTFHILLLSESAFYNNSYAVLASLTSATIPNAIIILESTATAARTAFRSIWENSEYHKHFISTQDHENYRDDPDNISEEDWKYLQETFSFTDRSSASFWWKKLQNEFAGNQNHLLREYPVIPAHSWTAAAGRFISTNPRTTPPVRTLSKTKIWIEPRWGGHFIVGVDPAAGVGRDASSIVVWDLQNKKIAALYSNNTDKFPDLVEELQLINKTYSPHAYYVESNGIGAGLVGLLQREGLSVVEVKTNESSKYSGLLLVKKMVEGEDLHADENFAGQVAELVYELSPGGIREQFNHPGDTLMALSFCLLNEESYAFIIKNEPPRPEVPAGHWDMEKSLRIGQQQRKRRSFY